MIIVYEGKEKSLSLGEEQVDFYCGGSLNEFANVLINLKYRDRTLQESYTDLLQLLVKGGCRVDDNMNPVSYDKTSGDMVVNKDYIVYVPLDVLACAQEDPNGDEAAMIDSIKEGMASVLGADGNLFIFPSEDSSYKVETVK